MISVMMPVYNAGQYLRESIESILNQTETDFELLIVNDGSTDESENIILSYHDPRIKYFKKSNGGESSARNMALREAQGDFIVFQDADDVSLPHRLETLKRGFRSGNIGFVHSDMLLINEQGNPIGYWQSRHIEREKLLRFFLKIGTPFNNPSMMVRKRLFEGLWYEESLKIGPDTDMVSKFSLFCDSVHINEPLLLYRRHGNNISNQNDYEVLFKHVRTFIERHPLRELFPEIRWDKESAETAELKAKILLALFLVRKQMVLDANQIINDLSAKIENIADLDSKKFIYGIYHLMAGNKNEALTLLTQVEKKDHLVENYIGEIYAQSGDYQRAFNHFTVALRIKPDYEEASENIRSIGGAKGLHLIDVSWSKFLKKQ